MSHPQKRFAIAQVVYSTLWILCSLWFLSGVIRFPDAPIQPCGEARYCGKWGVPHSIEEFESFKFWETSIMIVWPILIVVGLGAEAHRRSRSDR